MSKIQTMTDQSAIIGFFQIEDLDISRQDWEDWDEGLYDFTYQGEERCLCFQVNYDMKDMEGTPGETWREQANHRISSCYWIESDGEERVVSLDKPTEEFILETVNLDP